jgi:large subunit ribosomal protein L28
MSRRCIVTSKGALRGHNVSHANNKSRKVWEANLQNKRLFDSETGTWVRLRVSTRFLRTVDRKGLAAALRDQGLTIEDVRS